MTLIEILNAALARLTFLPKTAFFGGDSDDNQLIEMANAAVADIVQAYTWGNLWHTNNVFDQPTDRNYIEIQLPADWDRYIPDTGREPGDLWKMRLPVSFAEWSLTVTGGTDYGIETSAIFKGDKIRIINPDSNAEYTLEYISNSAIITHDPFQEENAPDRFIDRYISRFEKDSDTFVLDDELLILAICARFKTEKEIQTAQLDIMRYQQRLRQMIGNDSGARSFKMSPGQQGDDGWQIQVWGDT